MVMCLMALTSIANAQSPVGAQAPTETPAQTPESPPTPLIPTPTPTPIPFGYKSEWHRFLHNEFSSSADIATVAGAGATFALRDIRKDTKHRATFPEALERHLFDRAVHNSLESGFAMAFRQDVSFKACIDCSSRGSRFHHALLGTLFADGYDGHREIAYSRFATAVGSAYIEHEYHPWTPDGIRVDRRIEFTFAWYAGKSLYNEFGRKPVNELTQRMLSTFKH